MDFIFDPSLVLYLPLYKLDGASFMSRDAYGHLCTVTGALWRPNGHYFDGTDDKIQVSDSPSLRLTGDTTWELWLFRTAYKTDGTILFKHYNNEFQMLLDTPAANGQMSFRHGDGGYELLDFTLADIPLNEWVKVSFVRTANPKEVKLYKCSALVQTLSYTLTPTASTEPIYIGCSLGTVAFLPATIGEVRIYNRALNPLEIQHNYLATKWRYR